MDRPGDRVVAMRRSQLVRGALAGSVGAALVRFAPVLAGMSIPPAHGQTPTSARMLTRPIPSTGEALPVIGCGTYVGFDQAPGRRA